MALVTVSEVARFALPVESTLLAGAAGLSRPVTWARLLRARPAALGSIEPGEVWLLSSSLLHHAGDHRATARLLRDVAATGVVAFVVNERVAADVLAEVDQCATPVFQVPPTTALAEVERAIVSLVVDRDRAIAERAQAVYDRLLATLVEDRGSERLAAIVHEVTGKAVYVLDEHFQPTLQAGGDRASLEGIAHLRRRVWEGQLDGVDTRLTSLRVAGGGALAALVRPLVLREAVEGYLAVAGDRDDFTEFDHRVADRAASVLAIELAKQSAVVEARLRIQGDFLEELLDNPAPALDQLHARARSLGYDLAQSHLVFVLRPRLPRGRPVAPRQQQRFVDVVRRRLVLANVSTLLRERDGTVQVLVPCPREVDPTQWAQATGWVDHLRLELERALAPDTIPVVAGVGRSPGRATSHHAALREAIQAAEIAASMPGGATTLHFARLGALRLIFHLAGHPELEAFQADLLGPLAAYDRQHRSELVQTLAAFFAAGGNHMQAARDLHVHRNTLIYRLERIRELLGGTDLEDPDTRLDLQLALKIRASVGAGATLPRG